MKKKFSILAFDLDDTALDEQKHLRESVQEALRLASLSGCHLVPTTGRVLNGIPKEIFALPNVRYVITANGAKVHDLQKNEVLLSQCFDNQTALCLVKELELEPCFISIFLNDASYTPTSSVDFLKEVVTPATLEYLRNSRHFVKDLNLLLQNQNTLVEKVNANYASEAIRDKVRTQLSVREDLFISSSMGLNLEINTRNAHKGAALRFLAEHLSVPMQDVMAIGDSDNDIQMLQAAGLGVAMGSARNPVRQAADATCPPASQSGLATAIYTHFLL